MVRKRSPQERLGNVVQVDGRLHVIEYSDLPEEVAQRRKPDGSLAVWAGSSRSTSWTWPFWTARQAPQRACPSTSPTRRFPTSTPPAGGSSRRSRNALKFERFIFDLLPSALRAIVAEVDAREHSALKNASGGEDTPATVQSRMTALHAGWLRAAGAELLDGVPIEISPLWALDAGEAAARVTPGMKITEPTYFGVASGAW